jgi:ATP-dependent Clp protease ATP-binding subunit ClpC
MFERYTETARRVIFFARYEASQWGDHSIQPPHLLLGLVREDKHLFSRLLNSAACSVDPVSELGLRFTGQKVSTSVDLPLSADSINVLALASEETEHMGQSFTSPGHLLLGLMRDPGVVSDLLLKKGLTVAAVREVVRGLAESRAIAGSEQIVRELRSAFRTAFHDRLKPELEPAFSYSLRSEKAQ